MSAGQNLFFTEPKRSGGPFLLGAVREQPRHTLLLQPTNTSRGAIAQGLWQHRAPHPGLLTHMLQAVLSYNPTYSHTGTCYDSMHSEMRQGEAGQQAPVAVEGGEGGSVRAVQGAPKARGAP